ncbi:2-keto-3-deoxy-galactonokinase [Pelagimonas phthalicica]|uniref:2-keto-3-deoxy-galactonokinase n=1 Tax=Pelagimonas phthalicica TaxID=1037362 RepID=A0A238J923_9RHOB|nr:2-dehydro-3-deoxygalactonokinase [Pelagimonas phthalicica]TDS94784.1 2-keto-3-deoxygalactonate kinase [Pelagimonas phthalicica]SMX26687.1 2-keto-3-deoxy-galactonokinase [Pelagimonas phthalicica]
MSGLAWIAVDWGTSHLRVWLMADDGSVLDRKECDQGMGRLTAADYERVLLEQVGAALPESGQVPVIVCGMAGSRQGWCEAPYASTPCEAPSLAQATQVATADARLDVRILPGIKQERPADVMRGEETQIAGFLAQEPDFDGVLCLPGTHNKWVHISAREVVSFRTFMTGELFALIGGQSVLRHSLGEDGWDDAAFLDAVSQGMSHPAALGCDLFALRAESLLQGLSPATARARLSGQLIGMELTASRPYWLGQDVVVLGESGIAGAYMKALDAQGAMPRSVSAADITLRGLTAAFETLKETK